MNTYKLFLFVFHINSEILSQRQIWDTLEMSEQKCEKESLRLAMMYIMQRESILHFRSFLHG